MQQPDYDVAVCELALGRFLLVIYVALVVFSSALQRSTQLEVLCARVYEKSIPKCANRTPDVDSLQPDLSERSIITRPQRTSA